MKERKCFHCENKTHFLVSVYFWGLINPFAPKKTEMSECNVVTMLNSMPPEK